MEAWIIVVVLGILGLALVGGISVLTLLFGGGGPRVVVRSSTVVARHKERALARYRGVMTWPW